MDNQINNISVQKWSFYTPFLYCFKFTLSRHTKYPNTITIMTPVIPAEKIQKTTPLQSAKLNMYETNFPIIRPIAIQSAGFTILLIAEKLKSTYL